MAIGYYEGFVVQRVGKATNDYMDYVVRDNEDFMGFFGASSADNISLMGVVVQDLDCSAANDRESYR